MARTIETTRRSGASRRANAALAGFFLAVNLYQFFVLPVWLLPSGAVWAWTLVPLALLNNPYWSLIHEAIHDLFSPRPRVNLLFGRAAAVLFGAPFRVLRLSHLLHHKLNRTPKEATELFDANKVSRLRAAGGYYFQILGGLYAVEFLSSILFFLPRAWICRFNARFIAPDSVSGILMANWTKKEALSEIRIDGGLVLTCFGVSLWCYGAHWPWFFGLVATRGLLISFLDNVYHYGTPVNDIFYAHNLRLPGSLDRLLLNFNLHGVHHKNPALPWAQLPSTFREGRETYQGNYFAAAARQLKGPLALDEVPGRGAAASG